MGCCQGKHSTAQAVAEEIDATVDGRSDTNMGEEYINPLTDTNPTHEPQKTTAAVSTPPSLGNNKGDDNSSSAGADASRGVETGMTDAVINGGWLESEAAEWQVAETVAAEGGKTTHLNPDGLGKIKLIKLCRERSLDYKPVLNDIDGLKRLVARSNPGKGLKNTDSSSVSLHIAGASGAADYHLATATPATGNPGNGTQIAVASSSDSVHSAGATDVADYHLATATPATSVLLRTERDEVGASEPLGHHLDQHQITVGSGTGVPATVHRPQSTTSTILTTTDGHPPPPADAADLESRVGPNEEKSAEQQREEQEVQRRAFCGPAGHSAAVNPATPPHVVLPLDVHVVGFSPGVLAVHAAEDASRITKAMPILFPDGAVAEAVAIWLEGRQARHDDASMQQQIEAATSWLIIAMPILFMSKEISNAVHQLLGVRVFTTSLSSGRHWARLRAELQIAASRIGEKKLAPLYAQFDLGTVMSNEIIAKLWTPHATISYMGEKPTQEKALKALFDMCRQKLDFEDPSLFPERVPLCAVLIIAALLNARFQGGIAPVAKEAGCSFLRAEAKGYNRSLVKLDKDYAKLFGPRAQWICDSLRCLLKAPGVANAHAAIAGLSTKFSGLSQVKNPFPLPEHERSIRGHLLACNVSAIFDAKVTFAELLAEPTTDKIIAKFRLHGGACEPKERWCLLVDQAVVLLQDQFLAHQPVKMMSEIQITFESFAQTRVETHGIYDGLRPYDDATLWRNFAEVLVGKEAMDLADACLFGQVSAVRHFLGGGTADVNARLRPDTGATALCLAAAENHCDVIRILIEQSGVDVDKATSNGRTPLNIAAQNGHSDVVKQLISAKADVNQATTRSGRTPLYMAAQYGHSDVVKQLVATNADINKGTTDGATPLNIAAQYGHADVVKQLVAANADVNMASTRNGATPLINAAMEGYLGIVKQLLLANADVHKTTARGSTALKKARESSHKEIIALLVAMGAK